MQATINPIIEMYSHSTRMRKQLKKEEAFQLSAATCPKNGFRQKNRTKPTMTLWKVIGAGGCALRNSLYEFLATSE
jgi:hypothetical protein